ncbi:MAG: hypothetical protein KKF24_07535, partial [Gammaproteobacteria bacterium]|nr:hypothetical protein [Gammaproteobacteria bacterium]
TMAGRRKRQASHWQKIPETKILTNASVIDDAQLWFYISLLNNVMSCAFKSKLGTRSIQINATRV